MSCSQTLHPQFLNSQERLSALIAKLRELINSGLKKTLRAVDSIQVRTCCEIERYIVEFEQQYQVRATYGALLVPKLAESLFADFGKRLDKVNLGHMRTFFQSFPILNAVRTKLSWTHYRNLVDDPKRAPDDNPTLGIFFV